jgi:hypothetical protein
MGSLVLLLVGNYHYDLAKICSRMRADRQALIAKTDYGHAAIFHLVIQAYYPLVIGYPIAFADELLPLVITGGRYRATDLVWFDLRDRIERLYLNFVGVLSRITNLLEVICFCLGMAGGSPSRWLAPLSRQMQV